MTSKRRSPDRHLRGRKWCACEYGADKLARILGKWIKPLGRATRDRVYSIGSSVRRMLG